MRQPQTDTSFEDEMRRRRISPRRPEGDALRRNQHPSRGCRRRSRGNGLSPPECGRCAARRYRGRAPLGAAVRLISEPRRPARAVWLRSIRGPHQAPLRSDNHAQAHRLQHHLARWVLPRPGRHRHGHAFDGGFSELQRGTPASGSTRCFPGASPSSFSGPTGPRSPRTRASRRSSARSRGSIPPSRKIVVSNSPQPEAAGGWGPARVVRRTEAHAEVAALKEGPGRDILVFGNHVPWNDPSPPAWSMSCI